MKSSLNDILFAIGFACLETGVAQQFGGAVAWITAGMILLSVSLVSAMATKLGQNVS